MDAAGATVVFSTLQERRSPDPATFIGKGKVQSLAVACDESDVDLVVVDNELTPSQLRHLGDGLERKVIDRTQLILDIFARRARTREGKRQVELAQLKYLLPRLAGSSTALSRLGGGIGTRGPGETKLETDRRRIRTRIESLQKEIDHVRQRRSQTRDRRQKESMPTVALVGYTNAGKTTLFNRLARERAVASNALFVTLDPLTRQVRLPGGGELLLSDTVGFIDRLPHALVAAFRATLEEVTEADLLLHVIDASHPERDRHVAAVRRVLSEVGAEDVEIIDVYNKVDALDADSAATDCRAVRSGGVVVGPHRRGHRRSAGARGRCAGARCDARDAELRRRRPLGPRPHRPALPRGSRDQPDHLRRPHHGGSGRAAPPPRSAAGRPAAERWPT